MIPTAEQNPIGLHQKYQVTKIDGTPVDYNAIYFVLRLDDHGSDKLHAKACREAAWAYIRHCPEPLIKIATDLANVLNEIEGKIHGR